MHGLAWNLHTGRKQRNAMHIIHDAYYDYYYFAKAKPFHCFRLPISFALSGDCVADVILATNYFE